MNHEDTLKAFLHDRDENDLSDKTLADDKEVLGKFIAFVGDRDLSEGVVLDYLAYIRDYTFLRKGKKCHYSKYSIYQIKSKVKKFLSYKNPELCEHIKPKMPKDRKLPEDMLSEEEIEKLLNACLSLRDKALIAFLFESGCRKGELLSIKIKNVVLDSLGAVVTIPAGKTGPRRIRVVFSASYLRQYKENHPSSDPESLLFCSTRAPYGGISDSGLKEQLKEIAKRAGIKKSVYAHLLRHSRATQLAKHLTEQQLKTYLGWTAGSSMASIYVHLSGQDIDPAILKMNGIEIEDTHTSGLKVGRCPRCKELNPETSAYCGKCGLPLKEEMRATVDKADAEGEMLLMQIMENNPELRKALTEELYKLTNNKSQA